MSGPLWNTDLQLEIKYEHVETLLCKLILNYFFAALPQQQNMGAQ